MTREELVTNAEHELAIKSKRLKDLSTSGAVAGTLGTRNEAERHYYKAYEKLVKLGARRKLRGKYRAS